MQIGFSLLVCIGGKGGRQEVRGERAPVFGRFVGFPIDGVPSTYRKWPGIID